MEQDWKESGDTLEKTFRFKDFKVALSFVNDVGQIAERMNHHPDICIQNYNEVMISTTTHNEGHVVTQKDHKLAHAIDSI